MQYRVPKEGLSAQRICFTFAHEGELRYNAFDHLHPVKIESLRDGPSKFLTAIKFRKARRGSQLYLAVNVWNREHPTDQIELLLMDGHNLHFVPGNNSNGGPGAPSEVLKTIRDGPQQTLGDADVDVEAIRAKMYLQCKEKFDTQLKLARSEITRLTNELVKNTTIPTDYEALQAEHEVSKSKYADLECEHEGLKRKHADLESENEALRARVAKVGEFVKDW